MKKKLVYISAPYRADTKKKIKENIRYAQKCGIISKLIGYYPIIPHINSLAVYGLIGKEEEVMPFDLALLSKCDILFVCTDRISEGMKIEINFCKKLKIPVFYMSPIFSDISRLFSRYQRFIKTRLK